MPCLAGRNHQFAIPTRLASQPRNKSFYRVTSAWILAEHDEKSAPPRDRVSPERHVEKAILNLPVEMRKHADRYTGSLDHRRNRLVELWETQSAGGSDGANPHRVEPEIPFGKTPPVPDRLVIETYMLRQIDWGVDRALRFAGERRRAYGEALAGNELFGIRSIVPRVDEPDRDVELVAIEVRLVVARYYPNVDVGAQPIELRQSRGKPK